ADRRAPDRSAGHPPDPKRRATRLTRSACPATGDPAEATVFHFGRTLASGSGWHDASGGGRADPDRTLPGTGIAWRTDVGIGETMRAAALPPACSAAGSPRSGPSGRRQALSLILGRLF
ncbi:MAG: hypothetical protein ACK4MT_05125, partial [Thermaurantiacus tibetensis]